MRVIDLNEVNEVSGGDAAATRPAGTNSWGEPMGGVGSSTSTNYQKETTNTTGGQLCFNLLVVNGCVNAQSTTKTQTTTTTTPGLSISTGGDLLRVTRDYVY